MAVAHTSKIEFTVELDENKIPENISWTAEDLSLIHISEPTRPY